jgi:hypothetical protein|tara:strand:+ start:492 stop:998 length:507 start_codon:yes stop_codon:yes gene_type:complete
MEEKNQELTPLDIGNKIKKLSNLDIYENTRKRPYVENRALVCYLLREKLNMRWKDIAAFFNSQGKNMDHASAMHLVKMFPIYKRDNKDLTEFENTFVFKSRIPYDEIDKVNYLENKYNALESKYLDLEKTQKNPLVKMVLTVPDEKFYEFKDKLKLIINALSWQNKSN